VIGLTLAAELIRQERFVEAAVIGVDNQAAIRALEYTKGAPGQHLVDQLQDKIEEIHGKHRDEALEIWWTPGHEGIRENERADEEAKKAARGDSSPDDQLPLACRGQFKTSRSTARQTHTRKVKGDATTQFMKSLRYPCLQGIDPSTPSPKFHKGTE